MRRVCCRPSVYNHTHSPVRRRVCYSSIHSHFTNVNLMWAAYHSVFEGYIPAFASHTWSSASLKTATVRIPILRAVFMTLQAISPLLAISSLSIGRLSLLRSTFDPEAADILRHAKACELMACVVPRSLHLANPNMPSSQISCSLPAELTCLHLCPVRRASK